MQPSRPIRDEAGIAMITVILIMMIVSGLGIMAVRTSVHNAEQSALDRHRIQAVAAAEGGIDAVMQTIEVSKPADVPCASDVTGALSAGAANTNYVVSVTYYDTYPPGATPMACAAIDADHPPKAAVIRAEGVAGAADRQRTMETLVQLNPIIGGFGSAIFSDTGIELSNPFTLRGNDGADANIYTNGSLTCSNSPTVEGSVYAQNGATMANSCKVLGELWTNNNITMSNTSSVGGDATSSTGTITLNHPGFRVDGDAKAGGAISGTTRVRGSSTPNSASGPPPQTSLPEIEFIQAKWEEAGYEVHPYSSCPAAKSFLMSTHADMVDDVKDVVRITGNCTLSFQNSDSEVTLSADLAIILDGNLSVQQGFAFRSDPSDALHTLHAIIPWTKSPGPPTGATHTCTDATSSTGKILVENNSDFSEVKAFVYAPCYVDMENRADFNGQIFSTTVEIDNNFDMNYEPIDVPGAGETIGHTVDVVYMRETRNT